jgi:hypothetical protein
VGYAPFGANPPYALRKIDEALVAVRRGEVATDAEVEAVLAKHRGA